MSFLNSLENRFGRFAVPGLVTILAGFQVAVWLAINLQPGFGEFLTLDRELVTQGQVWRLITWIFIPSTMSPIWILFGALLMMTFSAVLDHAWGAFRVNLYVFSGIFFIVAGTMIFDALPVGLTLYTSIFLAFCVIVPDYEIRLYFILPIKVKWLGLITGAITLLNFVDTPVMRLPIACSLLNFFIAFTPGFVRWLRLRGTVMERRMRFESAKLPEGTWFHKCGACGKTDVDDPKLEFRVTAEGGEYCTVCRPKK